jgi:electron transport complex protein RnfE
MSIADALGMGAGFTVALTMISSIRELLGNGTFLGLQVLPDAFSPAVIMILPPGAFLTIGTLLGFFNYLSKRRST